MKRQIVVTVAAVLLLGSVAGKTAIEKPYDFRRRIAHVHESNRRDWSLKRSADEFEIAEKAKVDVGESPSPLLARAAADFCDYCAQSMGVTASVVTPYSAIRNPPAVAVAIDGTMPARSYAVDVSGKGVSIRAADDRSAAQALYHLEDRMNLRCAPFLKFGRNTRRHRFLRRMTHSGWGCDRFPEAHLAQIAHAGLDTVLVFVKDVDITKDVLLDRPTRTDVGDIIRRAEAWGLDTYLYSYVSAYVHPDDPKAAETFEGTFGRLAAAYPKAKGLVCVGETSQFPTKDERAMPLRWQQTKEIAERRAKGDKRPLAGWFPCRDYPAWFEGVRRAIRPHAPDMEIVAWSYNWNRQPEDARLAFIDALPPDTAMMATFGKYFDIVKRNGLKSRTDDYTLVYSGPGGYFASEAAHCAKTGRRMYAMANTGGLTWDFGMVPYLPVPHLWKKRFDAIVKAHDDWKVAGLMENHHYGWWPGFISELSKESFTEGGMPFEEHLMAIASRDFGPANAAAACSIWSDWSTRFVDIHSINANQYGPFRYGPAYPFNAMEPDLDGSELPMPPRYMYPNYRKIAEQNKATKKELELLDPLIECFMKGADGFMGMASQEGLDATRRERALRMGLLGQYMARTCMTAKHVKEGLVAERAGERARVVEIARAELENCRAALALTLADSRLGWEPTMLYRGGPDAIRWKIDYLKKHYGLE